MRVLLRGLDAASDPRLSAVAIRQFVHLLKYADDDGDVGADENGRPLASAANVASSLGIGSSTAFKSFALLESCGYLRWEREQGVKIKGVKAGKVRIILPENANA